MSIDLNALAAHALLANDLLRSALSQLRDDLRGDIEAPLQKALSFQGVFDELAQKKDSQGYEVVPMLEDAHERLCGVDIERLPYAQLIARYDTPGTLFYLDPPYHGCEDDYGKGVFSEVDFEVLATPLASLQGRFVVSISDTPAMHRIFDRFAL